MGILLDAPEQYDYLRKYGFTLKKNNCINSCGRCYEKCISISSLYDMWIAIDTINREIHYYVEYDCGGEIATIKDDIPSDISIDNEIAFMEWLDKEATDYAERYA